MAITLAIRPGEKAARPSGVAVRPGIKAGGLVKRPTGRLQGQVEGP